MIWSINLFWNSVKASMNGYKIYLYTVSTIRSTKRLLLKIMLAYFSVILLFLIHNYQLGLGLRYWIYSIIVNYKMFIEGEAFTMPRNQIYIYDENN